MNEVRACVPCRNVKFDYAIARNSKCRNPVKLRSRTVSEIIWRSDADKPFLTLHRPQTLADAPMTRHLGEGKPIFLEVHDPQAWAAIRKSQLRLFDAGFRIVWIVVELAARSAGINDFAIWRKYLRFERLRWEPGHGEFGHNKN